jgi:hypothetical protein
MVCLGGVEERAADEKNGIEEKSGTEEKSGAEEKSVIFQPLGMMLLRI